MNYPQPDPSTILDAARSWQNWRALDHGRKVETRDAESLAAFLAPLMLRPPKVEHVRELLDAAGDLIDLEDAGDPNARLAKSRAINAAWVVGGERP